jgi:HD-GYP domain-containing protein (c-di-GMP phosphodiesterase class II)
MKIPDAILRKPGALTQEEIAIMKEHCYAGYQMLRKIPFLKEAAEIVYAHEERWDGTGYPRGIKGNDIPLGARLFAVVDALDMIMSDQPYSAAQPFSAAREEIIRWSGRQFDPDVVKTFLTIPEFMWHDLRKEIDQHIYHFPYSQKTVSKTPQKMVSKA